MFYFADKIELSYIFSGCLGHTLNSFVVFYPVVWDNLQNAPIREGGNLPAPISHII